MSSFPTALDQLLMKPMAVNGTPIPTRQYLNLITDPSNAVDNPTGVGGVGSTDVTIGFGGAGFVFSSNLSPGQNVFTSWANLAPILAATKGPKTVEVDGVVHITAGHWSNISDIVWVAGNKTPFEAELIIDDGATFDGATTIKWTLDAVEAIFQGTTVPAVSFTTGLFAIIVRNFGFLGVGGSQPFMDLGGSTTSLLLAQTGGTLGSGVVGLSGSGASLTVQATANATISDNIATAGYAGSITISYDSSTVLISPQTSGNLTLNLLSSATSESYTPASLPHWSGTAPTSVANALDRIAAKITPIP